MERTNEPAGDDHLGTIPYGLEPAELAAACAEIDAKAAEHRKSWSKPKRGRVKLPKAA